MTIYKIYIIIARYHSKGLETKSITQARGGGSEAQMAKLTAASQKPLILWCPNLVTFSFYP